MAEGGCSQGAYAEKFVRVKPARSWDKYFYSSNDYRGRFFSLHFGFGANYFALNDSLSQANLKMQVGHFVGASAELGIYPIYKKNFSLGLKLPIDLNFGLDSAAGLQMFSASPQIELAVGGNHTKLLLTYQISATDLYGKINKQNRDLGVVEFGSTYLGGGIRLGKYKREPDKPGRLFDILGYVGALQSSFDDGAVYADGGILLKYQSQNQFELNFRAAFESGIRFGVVILIDRFI